MTRWGLVFAMLLGLLVVADDVWAAPSTVVLTVDGMT